MDTKVSVETKGGKSEQPDIVPIPVRLTKVSMRQFLFELLGRFTSRKLWAFVFSVAVCWGCLERGVNHLYSLQVWQAATYGGMFLCVMGAIAAMACKYMGVENVSYTASSSVSGSIASTTDNLLEKRENKEEITEHIDPRWQTPELQERYEDR